MKPWLHVPCDWRRPTVSESYNLYWSDESQFGQLHPRPSPAEVQSYYEVEYYTHANQTEVAPKHNGFWGRLREHLAWRLDFGSDITVESLSKLVPQEGRRSVLEIGCGDGKLLSGLQNAGWRVTGIEPDPVARNVAIKRGLDVLPGTAEEPPLTIPMGQFDLVVMQHVLEHCLDPIQALRIAASYTNDRGILVVETPNNLAIGRRIATATWPWLDVPRHLNFFTPKSLRNLCSLAGMVPVVTEYTGYVRQFQTPWSDNEKYISQVFNKLGGAAYSPSSPRDTWQLFLKTALASPQLKYDSVRVVAKRPE